MNSNKNGDSVIIVLHEIYGINQHIIGICDYFEKVGMDVICPNLIKVDKPFLYDEEDKAYKHFIEGVGFEWSSCYVEDIISNAKNSYKNVFILGYSIGATIAWICSSRVSVSGIIGVYGSRIRDYTDICPKSPVLLIFADEERAFNIDESLLVLQDKINVDAHLLKGRHGFADPFNDNYNNESSNIAVKLIDNFIKDRMVNNNF